MFRDFFIFFIWDEHEFLRRHHGRWIILGLPGTGHQLVLFRGILGKVPLQHSIRRGLRLAGDYKIIRVAAILYTKLGILPALEIFKSIGSHIYSTSYRYFITPVPTFLVFIINSSNTEIQKAVEEYIRYYNNDRIQAKTKWMLPVKFREASMCRAKFIHCVQNSGYISL
ncbi:MAG: IS3 family transposase [Eubacteriaceae bacterium]|nr:IS3 family transposase [Eubacteriaceae bacterium]